MLFIARKEDLKESRGMFQKTVSGAYNEVKRTMGMIDQFSLQEVEMSAVETCYRKEKEAINQSILIANQEQITSKSLDFIQIFKTKLNLWSDKLINGEMI